jgi:archaemetzincin
LGTKLLNQVSKAVYHIFGYPTEIIAILEEIDFAFDPVRDQYHSTPVLDELVRNAPHRAFKVLAIAEVDLFIPILTHVYGEAQLGGKACIISTYRLKESLSPINSHEVYPSRVIKEAIHELGHTFNLRHCRDHACIMHYCRTVKDVDRKANQLCRYCNVLLEDELIRLKKMPRKV